MLLSSLVISRLLDHFHCTQKTPQVLQYTTTETGAWSLQCAVEVAQPTCHSVPLWQQTGDCSTVAANWRMEFSMCSESYPTYCHSSQQEDLSTVHVQQSTGEYPSMHILEAQEIISLSFVGNFYSLDIFWRVPGQWHIQTSLCGCVLLSGY